MWFQKIALKEGEKQMVILKFLLKDCSFLTQIYNFCGAGCVSDFCWHGFKYWEKKYFGVDEINLVHLFIDSFSKFILKGFF